MGSTRSVLAQACRLSGQSIDEVFVDRGCREHDELDSAVCISVQKRVIIPRLKRRQAIEKTI